MRLHTGTRRPRSVQLGVPAALIGTITGALALTPATAASVPEIALARELGSVRIVPAAAAPTTYVVKPGDTVSAIAGRLGLRTVDVLSWNSLTWRSVIYPGQTLRLQAPAAAAAPAAPTAASAPASATTHTVAAGDTVYAIARKYGTTVDAVLSLNGISRAAIIYPGQKLTVSGSSASAAPAPAAPAAAPASSSAASQHTVVAGDTLYAIAQKYATTVSALFSWNSIGSSSIIYPGQKLVVRAPQPAAPASAGLTQLSANLDAEQAANAAMIIRVGRELGVSDRGIAIALAAAMVESGIRNLDYGDRDSLGLFQQRPSAGWGTPAQILDAERSTRVFYGGPKDPNGSVTNGLLDVPGASQMSFTDAAQAVQISAFPNRYGQWETAARGWLALHG